MKIKRVAVIAISIFLFCGLNAQEIADKIHREININGEYISKWFIYDRKEIYEYDDYGILQYQDITGEGKYYHSYNDYGNVSYSKLRDGDTFYDYEYDSNGNIIYKKMTSPSDKYVLETYYEYDSKNRIIHEKSCPFINNKQNTPSEHWYKYDNQNRMIYEKENAVSIGSSKGSSYFEYYYEYDSYGNKIHRSGSGAELFWEYKYDSNGRVIYSKDKNYETWYSYGNNEKITCNVYSSGSRSYSMEAYYSSDDGKIITKVFYFCRD